jgi:hypothetical protein
MNTSPAVREVAPWLARLARVGFVAQGVLYLTIGVLSALAAAGMGGRAVTDAHGAMGVLDGSFGRPLLAILAVGLFGYGAWRIVQSITDAEQKGSDAKGIAVRIGTAAAAIAHLAIGWGAMSLALWNRAGGGHDANAQHWTARALDLPGGSLLVVIAALGFAAFGIYQLRNAWIAKLDDELELGRLAPTIQRAVIAIGRFGIAARGVVFVVVAVLFGRAAMDRDPSEAGTTGSSLRELFAFGRWPFVLVAAGLAAYGIYELINARYRRIRVVG